RDDSARARRERRRPPRSPRRRARDGGRRDRCRDVGSMSGTLQAAVVRVPGSTTNLGSGFDTIGLALDRHLVASFEPDASGCLRVERTGTLTRLASFRGPDLVAETFRTAVAATGVEASGSLRLHSTIPVIRGFGS